MDITRLEPGTKDIVNVFIESEKGSKSYYKYDPKTGLFNLNKLLKLPFTGSFGFVPKTHHIDANTMDVIILASDSIKQGIVVQARPIGIVRLKAPIPDEVLIAVSLADGEYKNVKDISDIDEETMKNLKSFLEEFKELKVDNVLDSQHAKNSVRRSIELYQRSRME
ncbi:MAG: inorganic diphosphatase [Candidatus Aenigmarchaeota archaeon]|nr:inorganic diphosphatase [Candidatus Aenigmarchaeota archaeon]